MTINKDMLNNDDKSPLDEIIESICNHPAFRLDDYLAWKAWNPGLDIIHYKPVMMQEWENKQAEICSFGNVDFDDYAEEENGEDLELEKMRTLEKITGSI
jgi:hypothetical protein